MKKEKCRSLRFSWKVKRKRTPLPGCLVEVHRMWATESIPQSPNCVSSIAHGDDVFRGCF
jgi:hypothetical protein